jgi:hypothetical protein
MLSRRTTRARATWWWRSNSEDTSAAELIVSSAADQEECRLLDRLRPVLDEYQSALELTKPLAGCSWGNRPCRALDQAHPKPFLDVADHFAHARRRECQLLGRLGEAFQLDHGHKGRRFGETRSMHWGDHCSGFRNSPLGLLRLTDHPRARPSLRTKRAVKENPE